LQFATTLSQSGFLADLQRCNPRKKSTLHVEISKLKRHQKIEAPQKIPCYKNYQNSPRTSKNSIDQGQ